MKNWFWIVIVFIFIGCKSDLNFVDEYMLIQGDAFTKSIRFPKNLIQYNSELVLKNDFFNTDRLLICTGDLSCSTCLLFLDKIDKFQKDNSNSKICFIGVGDTTEYLRHWVNRKRYSFPIFYDDSYQFVKENKLDYYDLSFYLLNGNQEIVFTGQLLENKIINTYFIELISNK